MALKDNFHNYSITQEARLNSYQYLVDVTKRRREVDYKFYAHYHPYTDELIDKLNADGLVAMLDTAYLGSLQFPLATGAQSWYTKGVYISDPFPVNEIDVSDDGPYSVYNWELFFHAPLAVAVHLSKNQRFEESQKWFHYIFDPTSTDKSVDPPQRFWKFLRFRQETKPEFIQDMLKELSDPADSDLKTRIEKSIQAWRDNPFQPHIIARGRALAYQLNVIMKYLDNLIAWGDNLFRQENIEGLNEATQIYVLAANILGSKPQKIPPRGKTTPKTYADLKAAGIDEFGNALIEMENDFPFNISPTSTKTADEAGVSGLFGIGRSLYFCIPQNDQLLAYWDTIDDRLFKLRHCMNIEGEIIKLPLFDAPIDPGMLVKAVAAGLDLASIINNINQPVSNVRGPALLQKALEICAEVKSLGSALLSAIEKGEGEHLAMLRQEHEVNLLSLMSDVKFLQWKESEAATASLLQSRNIAFERFAHYKMILGNSQSDIDAFKTVDLTRSELTEENFDSVYAELVDQYGRAIAKEAYRKEDSVGGLMEFAGNVVTSIAGNQLGKTLPLNKNENAELNIFLPTSDTFSTLGTVLGLASPILALIPQFNAHGTPLGVGAAVGFGGVQLKAAADKGSEIAKDVARAFASSAERASKMAGYYRRAEDYVLQANLAGAELMQYGKQIISSLIREQTSKKEFDNHQKQIEQAAAVANFMNEKFSNEELYTWMKGEISRIYFDCYKFAFDTAKRAEQTMKYELMRTEFDSLDFIKFGYWDNARKGLLAGENLYLDLKRLEMAYHDQNRREYEMTKHASVSRLNPIALLQLKATGSCEIDIPEWLYDLDSPGQFMRRIKTVAVSIPCISGPYTGIHCKLSLLGSSIRTSSLLGDGYPRLTTEDDSRFRDFTGTIESVVTSSAQNDSGLFETNLRDERYLPFEGAGAISKWRITLLNAIPQFDFETISDVILHIRYTAREAGQLIPDVVDDLKTNVLPDQPLLQLFCINYEFATEWSRFISAAGDTGKLDLTVTRDNFPYWTKPIGLDDTIAANFSCIDFSKNRVTLATAAPDFAGTYDSGWTLTIDQATTPEVFNFLKMNRAKKIYMAVAYKTLD